MAISYILFGFSVLPALGVYASLYFDFGEYAFGMREYQWNRWTQYFHCILASYFKFELVKTAQIEKQSILVLHPHGIIPAGGVYSITNKETPGCFDELFPKLKKPYLLGATCCFMIPLVRELFLCLGIRDCSKFNAAKYLENGHTIGLFPGGAKEALYDSDTIEIIRKRGFIRLAIEYGVDLVPVYTFNESSIFEQVPYDYVPWILNFLREKLIQHVFGISLPLLLHFTPRTKYKLVTVIGTPIKVKCNENPTEEEINKYFEIYLSKLKELYNKYSPIYNAHHKELVVKS